MRTNWIPTFLPLFVVLLIILSRRPLDILRRRGAISPGTAVPVDDMSPSDRRRLDRLVAQGLVKEATPGRFYFDREAELERMRRKRPIMITLIVVLAILAVVLIYLGRPHVQPIP